MKTKRRRVAVGFLLLFAVIAVALAVLLPYRPVLVVGPVVPPWTLSLAEPVPGLRLHIFNTGANRMSSLLVGDAPPWRAAPAFVIEHPGRGLIAFDLGLSHAVAEHGESAIAPPVCWLMESRGRVGLTLDGQMREAGLDPRDVGIVVLSHLHQDHTGDADLFADAVFFAGEGTREVMIEGSRSPFSAGAAPEWHELASEGEGSAAPVGPFGSGFDLFGDGSILLIATGGGHAREDVMAIVNLSSGPVLLTGDAAAHHDWLQSDDVERIATDPERAAVVRNQIRSLRESGNALVIPGHDLRRLGPARPDLIHQNVELFKPSAWPIGSGQGRRGSTS